MSRRTQKNVGVIGLGIIGQRVADSLRRRGFSVFVWNRTPRPFPNFVGSPAEIAQLCDYIQIFVSDDEALLEIVQQLKQSLKAHHIVMAHSTVAPHTVRAAAEIVDRRGAQFLDAPFTGSKIAAEKGELVYYIGGDDAAFKRARPVLEASSKEIIEIGKIGDATLIKIATNLVTATTVQATAEALALVQSSGLAPQTLVAAMRGNASNSATLTMKLQQMIDGDFAPHFSVKHMLKDLQIARRLAHSGGLTLGAMETVRESLLEETRHDRGDYDYSSIAHMFFPDGRVGTTVEESVEAEEVEQHPSLDLDERVPEEQEVVSTRGEPDDHAEEFIPTAEPEEANIDDLETPILTETESALADMDVPDAAVEEVAAEQIRIEEPVSNHEERPVLPIVSSETTAPDEEERRGFFRRMFGKSLDY